MASYDTNKNGGYNVPSVTVVDPDDQKHEIIGSAKSRDFMSGQVAEFINHRQIPECTKEFILPNRFKERGSKETYGGGGGDGLGLAGRHNLSPTRKDTDEHQGLGNKTYPGPWIPKAPDQWIYEMNKGRAPWYNNGYEHNNPNFGFTTKPRDRGGTYNNFRNYNDDDGGDEESDHENPHDYFNEEFDYSPPYSQAHLGITPLRFPCDNTVKYKPKQNGNYKDDITTARRKYGKDKYVGFNGAAPLIRTKPDYKTGFVEYPAKFNGLLRKDNNYAETMNSSEAKNQYGSSAVPTETREEHKYVRRTGCYAAHEKYHGVFVPDGNF